MAFSSEWASGKSNPCISVRWFIFKLCVKVASFEGFAIDGAATSKVFLLDDSLLIRRLIDPGSSRIMEGGWLDESTDELTNYHLIKILLTSLPPSITKPSNEATLTHNLNMNHLTLIQIPNVTDNET